MDFIENGTSGRPALALIATTAKRISLNGLGGEHNKTLVPAGYIRAVRLIAQLDAGGLSAARRDLLAVFGKSGNLPRGWRVAEGSA